MNGGRCQQNCSSKLKRFALLSHQMPCVKHMEINRFNLALLFETRGFPFDSREIDELAVQYGQSLRDGTHQLFRELSDMKVPLLVFSAGLGDSILAVLKHAEVMYPNVKIVSNFLQYENGMLNGLDNDAHHMIHTFNKNEAALRGTEYYDSVHDRQHILLMG